MEVRKATAGDADELMRPRATGTRRLDPQLAGAGQVGGGPTSAATRWPLRTALSI